MGLGAWGIMRAKGEGEEEAAEGGCVGSLLSKECFDSPGDSGD